MKSRADTFLILIILALLVCGALMFSSAALGLLARGATHISSVVFNHFILGIGGGVLLFFAAYLFDYKKFREFAPYIYGAGIFGAVLPFVPGLGFEHSGSRSWVDFGVATFQTSEFLKVAAIIGAAAVFSLLREHTASWRGLAALAAILAAPVLIMLLQPDVGTLGIIVLGVMSVYIAAGARLRDLGLLALIGTLIIVTFSFIPRYDYVFERVDTFIDPASQNALGEGFQIRQSLIAIGSGGLTGRGFGQGVQKFTYLPEPMGDSIYAVLAEEFGFIGGLGLIVLFLMLALKGYGIAAGAGDLFGGLLAIGISTYLAGEAFINIGAMLGMAPLTGIPLTFISQGGSAMLISLASAGILLNISKRQAKKS
ncbi:MAG: FtsW/RodA/SpoVE family cell cycle protein [Minisyncoccia bacterium]